MSGTSDFVVIGGGIVGITIARELKHRQPGARVTVLEKEPRAGMHSSGRNSGVLHSGIYYAAGSLKARVCAQGAREMAAFCDENRLPLNRCGKILLAVRPEDGPALETLAERAPANGVQAERLDERALRELEPEARSATGAALLVRQTSVGGPGDVMRVLVEQSMARGIELRCGVRITEIRAGKRELQLQGGETISYGHVVNAAGLHADTIAHRFGVGHRYTLLPFKGLYWKLDPRAGFDLRHLLYPVPDLRVPFLGVHSTTTIDGQTYLGPTAVPALGRENYHGLEGTSARELLRIGGRVCRQLVSGHDGFRALAWQEGRRFFKPWFLDAARAILPRLRGEHLLPTDKVGIRAQMLDRETGHLVNDFLIERGPASTHVLNAISPAWTCSFPLARLICDEQVLAEPARLSA